MSVQAPWTLSLNFEKDGIVTEPNGGDIIFQLLDGAGLAYRDAIVVRVAGRQAKRTTDGNIQSLRVNWSDHRLLQYGDLELHKEKKQKWVAMADLDQMWEKGYNNNNAVGTASGRIERIDALVTQFHQMKAIQMKMGGSSFFGVYGQGRYFRRQLVVMSGSKQEIKIENPFPGLSLSIKSEYWRPSSTPTTRVAISTDCIDIDPCDVHMKLLYEPPASTTRDIGCQTECVSGLPSTGEKRSRLASGETAPVLKRTRLQRRWSV
jgi:hypothetical protein